MTSFRTAMLSILISLAASGAAYAWLRPIYEDAEVVERSELIAVAHLKEGSIQYVPHKKAANEGASWEHHATLVITEVLKGKCDSNETTIIVHYGLDPVVGGRIEHDGFMVNLKGAWENYPKGIIEIVDTGNSAHGGPPLVKDAREDNLWFLRKRSGIYGREPGTGNYGIVDPEDLQSLSLKEYFLAYLSKDPEAAVKERMKTMPAVAERAQRYLDHREVQRILKIADPGERFARLLPYYKKRFKWDMKSEVKDGIVSCGKTAGEQLRKMFDNPEDKKFRQDIIMIWRDIEYKEAAPLLVDLLNRYDQFWEKQELKQGWWNSDVGSELSGQRRQNYGETYYAVYALRAFKDPGAREAIELTKKRWEAIKFDNRQIVEECAAALKELPMKTNDAVTSGAANKKAGAGNPEWLGALIAKFESAPAGNPQRRIYRYEYKGQTVYYVPPQSADRFSVLYDAQGKVIGAPDGGFTGRGDGRCPDFFKERKNEQLIWQDKRGR
ncbi:MAG: hypothetical protein NTX50_22895 [Candidatus Sumerlaeota bacterium]|nr:hypothetical protein [Candidatus Sumerlaeota bacterium]